MGQSNGAAITAAEVDGPGELDLGDRILRGEVLQLHVDGVAGVAPAGTHVQGRFQFDGNRGLGRVPATVDGVDHVPFARSEGRVGQGEGAHGNVVAANRVVLADDGVGGKVEAVGAVVVQQEIGGGAVLEALAGGGDFISALVGVGTELDQEGHVVHHATIMDLDHVGLLGGVDEPVVGAAVAVLNAALGAVGDARTLAEGDGDLTLGQAVVAGLGIAAAGAHIGNEQRNLVPLLGGVVLNDHGRWGGNLGGALVISVFRARAVDGNVALFNGSGHAEVVLDLEGDGPVYGNEGRVVELDGDLGGRAGVGGPGVHRELAVAGHRVCGARCRDGYHGIAHYITVIRPDVVELGRSHDFVFHRVICCHRCHNGVIKGCCSDYGEHHFLAGFFDTSSACRESGGFVAEPFWKRLGDFESVANLDAHRHRIPASHHRLGDAPAGVDVVIISMIGMDWLGGAKGEDAQRPSEGQGGKQSHSDQHL